MIRGLLAGLGLVAACAILARVPNLVEAPVLFLSLFTLAFACYGAGIWWLAAARGRRVLVLVLTVGMAARLVLLPAAPTLSTDAFRYVWDARVAHAGISPYLYPPWAKELEPLREQEIFPRLNHPTWRTIYPPGAQAFFRAVYGIRPDSVPAMKLGLGLAELLGLATVVGLLRAAGQPPSRAIIYAWSPLLLVEVWGTAHLEALVIPAVTGAVWAASRGRHVLSGALLGAGTLVKLYPAALLAILPGAAWPAAVGGFAAVVLLGYAPAVLSGQVSLGSLPRYLAEEHFNPGLLRSVLDGPVPTLAAAAILVACIAVTRREAPLAARAGWLAGGLVLLSPNIFPWYAVWLVPFLAVAPSLPWLAFTWSVAWAYAFFIPQPWVVPWWARVMEFAPLAAGGLSWLAGRRPSLRWQERST